MREAIALLNKAIELDPSFALPRVYAALVYEARMSLRVPPLGNRDKETCIELARSGNRVAAIPDAITRTTSAGTGQDVSKDGYLRRPLAMVMAPNGNLGAGTRVPGSCVYCRRFSFCC